MENVNAFCALNIDVTKTKFGQKLQHSPFYHFIIDIYILLMQALFELLGHDESSEVTPTPKIAEFRKWWHFLNTLKNKQQFSS